MKFILKNKTSLLISMYTLYTSILFTFPLVASAKTLKVLVEDFISQVLNPLAPLLVSLTVLLFLWGVLKYVTAGGDPEKRSEGVKVMTWGILAIFVMVSMWGLVHILEGSFNFEGSQAPFPTI